METLYDVLQVTPGAGPEEIRRAYYRLVKEWHPDSNLHRAEEAHRRIVGINEAWSVLKDPYARRAYDAELRGETEPLPPTRGGERREAFSRMVREVRAEARVPWMRPPVLAAGSALAILAAGGFWLTTAGDSEEPVQGSAIAFYDENAAPPFTRRSLEASTEGKPGDDEPIAMPEIVRAEASETLISERADTPPLPDGEEPDGELSAAERIDPPRTLESPALPPAPKPIQTAPIASKPSVQPTPKPAVSKPASVAVASAAEVKPPAPKPQPKPPTPPKPTPPPQTPPVVPPKPVEVKDVKKEAPGLWAVIAAVADTVEVAESRLGPIRYKGYESAFIATAEDYYGLVPGRFTIVVKMVSSQAEAMRLSEKLRSENFPSSYRRVKAL